MNGTGKLLSSSAGPACSRTRLSLKSGLLSRGDDTVTAVSVCSTGPVPPPTQGMSGKHKQDTKRSQTSRSLIPLARKHRSTPSSTGTGVSEKDTDTRAPKAREGRDESSPRPEGRSSRKAVRISGRGWGGGLGSRGLRAGASKALAPPSTPHVRTRCTRSGQFDEASSGTSKNSGSRFPRS